MISQQLFRIQTYRRVIANLGLFFFKHMKRFTVKSSEETINYILKERVSVSRYGDGEFKMMQGRGNGFQQVDNSLGEKLRLVLCSNQRNHIVCIPYTFENLGYLTKDAYGFWRGYIGLHCFQLLKMIPSSTYYDSTFTRFYMDHKNKSKCKDIIMMIKKLWDNRDLYIIEGAGTRMGVGNDLLENAKTVRRIIAPSTDAYTCYSQIIMSVIRHVPKYSLIICALGMTATVLTYDLAELDYWAVDIGHLDIEYEWYKAGRKEKEIVKNKSVNELGVNIDDDIDDINYHSQIICRIVSDRKALYHSQRL